LKVKINIKKTVFFLLVSILGFCNTVLPQSYGRIRGFVTDSLSGESLFLANVYIKELSIGTTTNEHGYFYLTKVPAQKKLTLTVSYLGYVSKSEKLVVPPNKTLLVNFEISPNPVQLGAIEKVGKIKTRGNETDIGLQKLSIRNIKALPHGVETDLFKALQFVSGVNFTADVSAKYYVRGSDNNQNLVLLNGATIYNPFHALGLFSVIDPEMIKDVKFYKGGFTSEYGERISSVTDVITIDGNRNNYGAKASLSMLTAKLLLEGPIPYGSFAITGRKSHSSRILGKLLNKGRLPFDFYDASVKINYSNPDFIPGAKFVAHFFTSGDMLKNSNLLKENFFWSNNIFGFSWFEVFKFPLIFELNVSVSDFKGEVNPNESTARLIKNKLREISLNYRFNYLYDNNDEFSGGLKVFTLVGNLTYENNFGGISSFNDRGANFVLFTKYKYLRFKNFGIDIGARYNFTSVSSSGNNYLEPRISFTYKPADAISIKGAWGKYRQEITTISDENEVVSLFEPYVIVPNYLKLPKAVHYSFGIEITPFNNWNIKSEVYYKKLSDITAINDSKKYDWENDLINGNGESYGLELNSNLNYSNFNLSASYTLAYAYKQVKGWLYYPRYDSRHYGNIIAEINLGKGWKTSLSWTFKTGLPFTPATARYYKLALNDLDYLNVLSHYIPFSVLGDRNIKRLPNYHRLDFSVSKTFRFSFGELLLDVNIINVYNRENLFYFDRSTGEKVNMLPFLPTVNIGFKL